MIDRLRVWRALFFAMILVHLPRRAASSGGRHRAGAPVLVRSRRLDEEWGAALRAVAARMAPVYGYPAT